MKIWKKFGKLLGKETKVPKAETIEHIAIFGSSHATPESSIVKDAFEVGKQLAQAGYVVINGGGPGVMRGSTLGAHVGGGQVIGVTFDSTGMSNFEGRDKENVFDREIKTTNFVERTLTLMKQGQVYVVFNGGTGTISEFGMAWGLARLYFGHHKPLILYGNFWKNIIEVFKKNMLLRPEELKVFKIVDSPKDVLKAIRKFEEEIVQGEHQHLSASKNDFTL